MGVYNHADSYPSGLGADIVTFVREHLDTESKVDSFKNKVMGLEVVEQEGKPSAATYDYYARINAADRPGDYAKSDYYNLLRVYQGVNTLAGISSGELKHWIDSKGFIKDSLFCEYAYIMNLDRGVLEFYEGFQQTDKLSDHGLPIYGPCKKVGSIAFSMATIDAMNACFGVEVES